MGTPTATSARCDAESMGTESAAAAADDDSTSPAETVQPRSNGEHAGWLAASRCPAGAPTQRRPCCDATQPYGAADGHAGPGHADAQCCAAGGTGAAGGTDAAAAGVSAALAAPVAPSVPPAQLYASQLQLMTEMGFPDQDANLQALVATGGNLDAAISRLVGS